jgi:hypothetical protein
MNYKTEFPDYDDTIALPNGWVDASWHNDICPSFEKDFKEGTYKIFCDYKNPERREVGGERFSVCRYLIGDDELEFIGQSEFMDKALAFCPQ